VSLIARCKSKASTRAKAKEQPAKQQGIIKREAGKQQGKIKREAGKSKLHP
jgi:hypothetical protein